jgi:predicted nucleic acid-binding protein
VQVVITDANVLINLAIADGMTLLRDLPAHEFVLPEEVRDEVIDPAHHARVQEAIAAGYLSVVRLESVAGLTVYTDLRLIMGAGEAACLAMAKDEGWMVASDEKRAFRREAVRLLGEARIVTTVDIYLLAIRAGVLTVGEADAAKAVLAANRFVVAFGSYQELLGD